MQALVRALKILGTGLTAENCFAVMGLLVALAELQSGTQELRMASEQLDMAVPTLREVATEDPFFDKMATAVETIEARGYSKGKREGILETASMLLPAQVMAELEGIKDSAALSKRIRELLSS